MILNGAAFFLPESRGSGRWLRSKIYTGSAGKKTNNSETDTIQENESDFTMRLVVGNGIRQD